MPESSEYCCTLSQVADGLTSLRIAVSIWKRVLNILKKTDHGGGVMLGKKTVKKTVQKAVKKAVKKATKVEEKAAKKVVKKATAVKKTVVKKTASAVKAIKKKISR